MLFEHRSYLFVSVLSISDNVYWGKNMATAPHPTPLQLVRRHSQWGTKFPCSPEPPNTSSVWLFTFTHLVYAIPSVYQRCQLFSSLSIRCIRLKTAFCKLLPKPSSDTYCPSFRYTAWTRPFINEAVGIRLIHGRGRGYPLNPWTRP